MSSEVENQHKLQLFIFEPPHGLLDSDPSAQNIFYVTVLRTFCAWRIEPASSSYARPFENERNVNATLHCGIGEGFCGSWRRKVNKRRALLRRSGFLRTLPGRFVTLDAAAAAAVRS